MPRFSLFVVLVFSATLSAQARLGVPSYAQPGLQDWNTWRAVGPASLGLMIVNLNNGDDAEPFSLKQHRHALRPDQPLGSKTMWRGHSCPSLLGLDGVGRAFLLAALDVDSHEGTVSIRATKCKTWASALRIGINVARTLLFARSCS